MTTTTTKKAKPSRALAAPAPSGIALPSRNGRALAPIPTPGLDSAQLAKAAAALSKHARAAAGEGLFADEDELVYLVSGGEEAAGWRGCDARGVEAGRRGGSGGG